MLLTSNQSASRSSEEIHNDFPFSRRIVQGVSDKFHGLLGRMDVLIHIITLHTPHGGFPFLLGFSCMFDSLQENFVRFIRIKIPNRGMGTVSVEICGVSFLRSIEKRLMFPSVISPPEGCHRFIPDELIFYGEIIRLKPLLELRLSAG